MKTQVEVLHDIHQENAKKGDVGYIDGYVQGADNRPYAAVVIKDFISLVSTYSLKVLTTTKGE